MNGETLYECGIDIDSSLSFEDGDLKLSKYDDNLIQAVTNRLNTNLDELELFYDDYGSVVTGFLGWRADDTTLHYIQTEVDNVLLKDPRIYRHVSEVEYTGEGKVRINLTLYTNNDNPVDLNLVINDTGVVEIEE